MIYLLSNIDMSMRISYIVLGVVLLFMVCVFVMKDFRDKHINRDSNIYSPESTNTHIFLNKHKKLLDRVTGVLVILGILLVGIVIVFYYTTINHFRVENENMRSELIEMNDFRKQNCSKIICLNDSGYSITKIGENYHFLYISDRGLAESRDIPVERTAIYYCNLDDDYFVDTYVFAGTEYYVLYIPEDTIYVIEEEE